MYPIEMTAPMAAELINSGFEELKSANAVDEAFNKMEGTALVVVNSVCGCAAANARPGALMSLENLNKPDKLYTVFAGVDGEAVSKAREHFLPYPPSSPSIVLMKDGELVHILERHHIEGRPASMISENLVSAYNAYCAS